CESGELRTAVSGDGMLARRRVPDRDLRPEPRLRAVQPGQRLPIRALRAVYWQLRRCPAREWFTLPGRQGLRLQALRLQDLRVHRENAAERITLRRRRGVYLRLLLLRRPGVLHRPGPERGPVRPRRRLHLQLLRRLHRSVRRPAAGWVRVLDRRRLPIGVLRGWRVYGDAYRRTALRGRRRLHLHVLPRWHLPGQGVERWGMRDRRRLLLGHVH